MTFGFPAYSTSSEKFDLPQHEIAGVIGDALDILGWRYESSLPNKFIARISITLWSWGERLTVDVSDDGTVTARSECVAVTQCFDWGKNGRNVKVFFDEVAAFVAAKGSSPPRIATINESAQSPVERVIKEE